MSSDSRHLVAAETALALTFRYLDPPHRLGDARVFTSGRVMLWERWHSRSDEDARRISRYLHTRPYGIAEDVNFLTWGSEALDRAVRFRWSNLKTAKDWAATFERVEGKNLDRIIDELLDSLTAHGAAPARRDIVLDGENVELRSRRSYFKIPVADLPPNKTPLPELHCTAGVSATIDRNRLLSLARELDASGKPR